MIVTKRWFALITGLSLVGSAALLCWCSGPTRWSAGVSGARDRTDAPPTARVPPGPEWGAENRAVPVLPDSERSYIWQIEHAVLVLDFRFWPRLSAAIRERNRDAARSCFTPEARTELIEPHRFERETLAFGRFQTSAVATNGGQQASVLELVDHLLDGIDRFDSDARVSIRTVFLSPQSRDRMDGPWNGRFLMRMWGRSTDGGPAEMVLDADFELAALRDEVPEPASWVASCRVVHESWRRADYFLLPEVGKSWGFDRALLYDNWNQPDQSFRIVTGGIYLTDYDLDGRMDALVLDAKRSILYHQVGPGKFEDATISAGLRDLAPGVAAAFADLDNDAYPDLIAGRALYQNTGKGSFARVGQLDSLADFAVGFAVADYDRDSLLDIYVTRGAPNPVHRGVKASWLDDRTGPGNSLLRNRGGWKFADVTDASSASAGTVSCFAAAWFDANGDLWPDLFVGDEFGSPLLLLNQKDGTFASHSVTGSFGGFCMGVAAGDLDDDGRIDLYLANMYSKAGERVLSNLNFDFYPPQLAAKLRHIVDGSELWRNRRDLAFEPSGRAAGVARVGWAYGPCLADLDNDGRLDIYAPAGFYSVSRDEPDG